MTIKINMDLPDNCADCKFKEVHYSDERYTCKLTNITFPAEINRRFEMCPLKDCKENFYD